MIIYKFIQRKIYKIKRINSSMKAGVIIVIIAVLILGGLIVYNFMSKSYNTASGNQNTVAGIDVQIQNFAFSPSSLTIKVGDTVTWTNKDTATHTVTSDSGGELSSPSLNKGETYSHQFASAGVYDYHCTHHPSMKAKIIVE